MSVALDLFAAGLLMGCFWSVLCRLATLAPSRTTRLVALQHAALGLGVFGAMVLPLSYNHAALAIGLSLYMLAGAKRWKSGPPGDLADPEDSAAPLFVDGGAR
jgi:hypothetical protein